MRIQLDYNGHYPRRTIEVTEDEYARIRELETDKYLFDTKEGRAMIKMLEKRPLLEHPPVVTVYA